MSHVIYNKETTKFLRIFRNGYWQDSIYATEGAAKAAFTRAARKDSFEPNEFAIAERGHFHKNIEKTEVRHGIVHAAGKEFEVSVNTPWTSGPWSETYHCS